MYGLPTSIELGGTEYSIVSQGDYRAILSVFSLLEDTELTKKERIYSALMLFYDLDELEDVLAFPDIEEAVNKMFEFINAGRPESRSNSHKLIDWEKDEAIIVSAINKVAGKEIRLEQYIHWWTFIGYYMAVGESTISTVVSIRDKIMSGKKLEKWENEFKRENPQYFSWNHNTAEDIDIQSAIMSLWNKE